MYASNMASERKKKFTLIGIYLGVIAMVLSYSGFSTLLPVAARDIGGVAVYPLSTSFTGLSNIVIMPLYGFLASRNPSIKSRLYCLSMYMGILSLLCYAFAPNIWVIIIPSLFYGFVSPGIFVISYTLIREMYDAKQAGLYLGVSGTMMSVGILLGPVVSGLLIDTLGWRSVPHASWPLMLIAAILVNCGYRMSESEISASNAQKARFDYSGCVSLTLFLGPLTFALTMGSTYLPFGSIQSICVYALSAFGLTALIILIRKKGGAAIIPATVMKDHNVLCLAICNLMFNFSNMAIYFFMPAYVLYVIGGSATQASLTTTALGVCGLFLGPFLGRAIAKAGNARNTIIVGTILRIAVTGTLLTILTPDVPLWLIYALMLIGGIYNSQSAVTFASAPQIQIKQELRVLGNSVIHVMQSLGANVGSAVYTLVIGFYGVAYGMKVALVIALATAVIGLLASLPLKKLLTIGDT
ncbi:MAG: MFS transporter [Oscillospiraceae bacterium]|nr:MFS transporter [Oscillospiraceae bacterium]